MYLTGNAEYVNIKPLKLSHFKIKSERTFLQSFLTLFALRARLCGVLLLGGFDAVHAPAVTAG